MIMNFLFFFLVSLFGVFAFDFPTVAFALCIYIFGLGVISATNLKDKENLRYIIKIYQIVFTAGFFYACICYLYMMSNSYSYLLAIDIDSYFMPVTESFIQYGSVTTAMSENWAGYNFFSRYHSGYFGYLIPFAYLSDYLGANLYVSMQFSTLVIASLSGVIIYKLLLFNSFEAKKAYKYAIIICLFSVLFFYSTQMLRDIHIMFLYLLGIYLTFKKEFSTSQLVKLIFVILLSCTLRIETGLFQFVLVPVYLLLTMQRSKKKTAVLLVSAAIAIAGMAMAAIYFNKITSIFTANSEYYFESDKGSGVIGNLQRIPVAGNALAVVYNAVQPLPFWLKFEASAEDYRPEMYNPMTFPLSFAAFFNWIALFFIFAFIFIKKIRKKVSYSISKPLLYQLYIGAIFLYIQATVISQRRLMAYYVIFYILFFIIFTSVTKKTRGTLMLGAASSYAMLQFFSLLYKI